MLRSTEVLGVDVDMVVAVDALEAVATVLDVAIAALDMVLDMVPDMALVMALGLVVVAARAGAFSALAKAAREAVEAEVGMAPEMAQLALTMEGEAPVISSVTQCST